MNLFIAPTVDQTKNLYPIRVYLLYSTDTALWDIEALHSNHPFACFRIVPALHPMMGFQFS